MKADKKATFIKIFIGVMVITITLAFGAPLLFKKKEEKPIVAVAADKYASQGAPVDPEPWYSPEAGGELRAMTNTEIMTAIERCRSAGMTYKTYSYGDRSPTVRIECELKDESE